MGNLSRIVGEPYGRSPAVLANWCLPDKPVTGYNQFVMNGPCPTFEFSPPEPDCVSGRTNR